MQGLPSSIQKCILNASIVEKFQLFCLVTVLRSRCLTSLRMHGLQSLLASTGAVLHQKQTLIIFESSMALTADVTKQVKELIASAANDKLVSNVTSLLKLLQDQQLAWRQQIQPMHIGAHPANRDGLGLATSEVHALLDDVLSVGFSTQEVRGICVEVHPGDVAVKSFNTRLAASAGGALPLLPEQGIRYASVAGSHLNSTLNCFLQGVVHAGSPLSMAQLMESDPAYYKACKEGLDWLVISSAVTQQFPELAGLIQSSQNVSSHLSRTESEIQLLRKIWHAVVAEYQLGKQTIVWSDIEKVVLRSKPTLGASGPMLFTFVLKFSGGMSGSFLEETLSFAKSYGHAQRALGPDVYGTLSVDLKGSEQYAIYRHCNLTYASDMFEGYMCMICK